MPVKNIAHECSVRSVGVKKRSGDGGGVGGGGGGGDPVLRTVFAASYALVKRTHGKASCNFDRTINKLLSFLKCD